MPLTDLRAQPTATVGRKPGGFETVFDRYDWGYVSERIARCTKADVLRAFRRAGQGQPEDFMALVSPAATAYIDQMAVVSERLTRRRFGKVIQMYIPLYLSNSCANVCTYCGFSYTNRIRRITLNEQEVLQEAAVLKAMGYDHVLLVSGEDPHTVHTDYFERMVGLLRPLFSEIQLEVQPLDETDYQRLRKAGVSSVLVYQETYHKELYRRYHPKGRKSNFLYRLQTPERVGKAGLHRMGLGVLLGLADWRTDSFFAAMHMRYLQRQFWQMRFSVSFPRIRPATGCQKVPHHVTDQDLIQLICAWRIFDEHVELTLSTRESPSFRDLAVRLGITALSAGSKTQPGGYATHPESLEQFAIHDDRSPQEVAAMLHKQGLEPVWKDWDRSFQ